MKPDGIMGGIHCRTGGVLARRARSTGVALALLVSLALVLSFPGSALAAPLGQVTAFNASTIHAGSITSGADGNLWFTDNACGGGGVGSCGIERMTPSGTITKFITGQWDADLVTTTSFPSSIAWGPDGNVWFTDEIPTGERYVGMAVVTGAIGRITPSGTITDFDATGSYAPQGITAGPDGNLWFTAEGGNGMWGAIGRITPSGTITYFTAGLQGSSPQWLTNDSAPGSITAGPDGNLWFIDTGKAKAIGRITPSGTITEFTAGLPTDSWPASIIAGPDGNVWFTDEGCYGHDNATCAIGRITPSGTITEFTAGLHTGSYPTGSVPRAITAGPDGNLWFTDQGSAREGGALAGPIGRITPSGQITEFFDGSIDSLSCGSITAGPDGNLWCTSAGQIVRFGVGSGGGIAPRNTLPPYIWQQGSPTVRVGGLLTAASGWWSGDWLESYAYQWLRDGLPITGAATGPTNQAVSSTYRVTPADAGHHLSVAVKATNAAGSTTARSATVTVPGGSSGGSGGAPTSVSPTQVARLLASEITPSGKRAKIAALLKSGAYTALFKALEAGTAVIVWYRVPPGARLATKTKAKPVLIAAGKHTFKAAGTATIKIKLTPAGKRLLKHAKQLKLTAKGTFTPTGKKPISKTKTFVLKR